MTHPDEPDTETHRQAVAAKAREVAEALEWLHDRASQLGEADRRLGWPVPLAWLQQWHEAMTGWAERLEAAPPTGEPTPTNRP